jgi:predicted MFS family arabinose efflux permease
LERNIRLLGFGAGIRALGVSMLYPFVSIFLYTVLKLPYEEVGFLLITIGVFPLMVSPFGGLITDRVGRRKLFLASMAVEACSVALVGVSMRSASLIGILVAFSAANVAGNALAGPAVAAYTADLAVGADRTPAFTWQRIGFNGGYTVGVAAGGGLIALLGYPEVGLAAGAIMGVAIVVLALTLKPSPYDIARSRDREDEALAPAPRPAPVRESLRLLANDRRFLLFALATFLAALTEGQWGNTLPLYINTFLGVPTSLLGIALAVNGVVVFLGQTPTTRVATGHTSAAIIGVILYAAAFLILGVVGLPGFAPLVVTGVFVSIIVLTFGENFSAIPLMTVPSNMAPATEVGSYNGAFSLLAGAGFTIAPALGGLALGATANAALVWSILLIPGVPAIFLFLWLGKNLPKQANTV